MSENLVKDQDPPMDAVEEMEEDKDVNSDEVMTEQATDDSSEEFKTPESKKTKIPAIENCPPPPGKAKKMRLGMADSAAPPEGGREEVEMVFDSCMEDSEMAGDGRSALKKRLFVDPSPVNDEEE